MAFTLWVNVSERYLAHPPFEYEPYMCAHGAWAGARAPRHKRLSEAAADGWLALGPYDFPAPTDKNLDDVTFVIALYAKTKPTGIADLDVSESKLVERNIASGETAFSLHTLMTTPYPKGQDYHTAIASLFLVERDAMMNALMTLARSNKEVLANPVQALGPRKVAEIEGDILRLSTKAILHLRYEIHDKTAQEVFLARPLPTTRPVHDSPKTRPQGQAIMARLEEIVLRTFSDVDPASVGMAPLTDKDARISHNPNEPLTQNLHLGRAETPFGPQLPLAWTMQDGLVRGVGSEGDLADLERGLLSTEDVLRNLTRQLASSLLRHGMAIDDFLAIVKAQFSERGAELHASFLTAVRAVVDVPAFTANRLNYESDLAYPNMYYLATLSTEKQKLYMPRLFAPDAGKMTTHVHTAWGHHQRTARDQRALTKPSLHRLQQLEPATRGDFLGQQLARLSERVRSGMALNAIQCRVRLANERPAKGAPVISPYAKAAESMAVIASDRFDTAQYAGETNSGDCDKGGFGIPASLHFMSKLLKREAGRLASDPMWAPLAAVAQVLNIYIPMMAGASATNPNLKADSVGSATAPKAPRPVPHPPTPIIGSNADKALEENGHAYGVIMPRVPVLRRLLVAINQSRVNETDRKDLLARISAHLDSVRPWEEKLEVLIAEGTGPTSMNILPLEEIYEQSNRADAYVRKGAAVIAFNRHLKGNATPAHVAIADLARAQQQTYEVWRTPNPRQRVSWFYKAAVHLISPWLADEFGGHVGHVIACQYDQDARRWVRGIDMGEFCRIGQDKERIMLAPVYARDITRREWDETIAPYMHCIANVQPMSIWARDPETATATALHQLLPTQRLAGLPATAFQSEGHLTDIVLNQQFAQIDVKALAQEANTFALIAAADKSDDTVVLPLEIPAWKLAAGGDLAFKKLVAAFETLKTAGEIKGVIFIRDQPLSQCSACIQALVAVSVPAVVDITLFPRPRAS